MKKLPTEKEIYNQILKEIQKRGFGLLSANTNLGAINTSEPAWAEVTLVGENYNTFLFQINPKNIPHDVFNNRFVYSDAKRVGLIVIKKTLKKHLPKLYPELIKTKLYLLNINKINPGAEYWSEIEEEIKKKYGQNLKEFLKNKKPIKLWK
jgi:hypothetical protein